MKPEPVTLEGQHVRLEPLLESHHAALCEVGLDPELWRWIPWRITTPEAMSAFMAAQFRAQAAGTELPFATVDRASGRVIGATRFHNIDAPNLRLEIGGTWIARPYQRSFGQHRSEVPDAASRLRNAGMQAGGIEDGLSQPALAERDSAARRP